MKKRGQYEVQDAYENANTSRQGLGVRELRGALRELSVEATANETIKMLQTYNKTGSGKLSLDEFTALIEGLDAFESEEAADTAVGAADCAAHPFDEPVKPEVPPAREPHDPPLKPPPIIVGGPPGPLPVPDGFRYVTALGVGYGRHRKPKGSTPRSSVEPARTRSAEGLLRGSVVASSGREHADGPYYKPVNLPHSSRPPAGRTVSPPPTGRTEEKQPPMSQTTLQLIADGIVPAAGRTVSPPRPAKPATSPPEATKRTVSPPPATGRTSLPAADPELTAEVFGGINVFRPSGALGSGGGAFGAPAKEVESLTMHENEQGVLSLLAQYAGGKTLHPSQQWIVRAMRALELRYQAAGRAEAVQRFNLEVHAQQLAYDLNAHRDALHLAQAARKQAEEDVVRAVEAVKFEQETNGALREHIDALQRERDALAAQLERSRSELRDNHREREGMQRRWEQANHEAKSWAQRAYEAQSESRLAIADANVARDAAQAMQRSMLTAQEYRLAEEAGYQMQTIIQLAPSKPILTSVYGQPQQVDAFVPM